MYFNNQAAQWQNPGEVFSWVDGGGGLFLGEAMQKEHKMLRQRYGYADKGLAWRIHAGGKRDSWAWQKH